MRKYAIIDTNITAGAAEFFTAFETKEDAIKEADYRWSMLTPREQEKRDGFIVGLVEVDENDDPVEDVLEVVKDYKG